MTPEHLRLMARALARDLYAPAGASAKAVRAPILFGELKIRTKESGSLVTFEPNEIQRGYLDELVPSWRVDPTHLRGVRDINLKGRQFGLSTMWMALFFSITATVPYTSTVILAHDRPTSEKMFETVSRFYDNLLPHRKPHTRYKSKSQLFFDEIGSSIYVGQAGSTDFGAATTINHCLASEVARWPDARKLMTALQEAVPAHGNIVLETTAQGFGNWFQQEWDAAYVNGDSVYRPKFFSWLDFPEYRIDPDEYLVKRLDVPKQAIEFYEEGPTPEEEALAAASGATPAQLAWRRWKKASLKERFEQEYPTTPADAFVSTGRGFFDRAYLQTLSVELTRAARDPEIVAQRSRGLADLAAFDPALRAEVETGGIALVSLPVPHRRYALTADPAEGLLGGDHDYASAHVFDVDAYEEVLHYHSRIDPFRFGIVLAALGRFYNMALICVERNNHGHATLAALMNEAHYPLPQELVWGGLYHHVQFDKPGGRQSRNRVLRPGWPQNIQTKNEALDYLKEDIGNRSIKLRLPQDIAELLSFTSKEGGRLEAEKGAHDDRVTSLALVAAMLRHARRSVRTYDAPLAGGAIRQATGQAAPSTFATASRRPARQYEPGVR